MFLPAFLSLYMMETFGHITVWVLSLSLVPIGIFNIKVLLFHAIIIFVYVYVVLPIAGRLLTDSLLSLLL